MGRFEHELFLCQCVQRDQHARGVRHVVRDEPGLEPGQKEVTIQLTDRIIVSPYAAKRLSLLPQGVMAENEKRFGPPKVGIGSEDVKK